MKLLIFDFSSIVKSIFSISSMIVLTLTLTLTITAQSVHSEESLATARKLSESGQILSLEKIIESAKKLKPGDFLEIELERKRDFYVYEVEMLDSDGQVWELKFNAKTGELIDIERDD
jgi:uncharacterized membrane protein YkoI